MPVPVSVRTKRMLVPVHRWSGLLVGPFLFLMAISGLVIQWDEAIVKRVFERQKWETWARCDRCPLGQAANRVIAEAPGPVITLSLRRPIPANTALEASISYRRADGRVVDRLLAVDPATLAVTGWNDEGSFGRSLIDGIYTVHATLLLGLSGAVLVLCLGVVLMVLAVSGTVLWWPGSGRVFKALRPIPRLRGINWLYDRHRLTGSYGAALLLLIAATGVVMAFRVVLAQLASSAAMAPRDMPHSPIAPQTAEAIALQTWPNARYTSLDLPTAEHPDYIVGFRWAGEPTAELGQSGLTIDARTGVVTKRYRQTEAPVGQRFVDLMIPLHSGEILGFAGRLVNMTAGVVMLFLLTTGSLRWLQRWRSRRTKRRVIRDPRAQPQN